MYVAVMMSMFTGCGVCLVFQIPERRERSNSERVENTEKGLRVRKLSSPSRFNFLANRDNQKEPASPKPSRYTTEFLCARRLTCFVCTWPGEDGGWQKAKQNIFKFDSFIQNLGSSWSRRQVISHYPWLCGSIVEPTTGHFTLSFVVRVHSGPGERPFYFIPGCAGSPWTW